MDEFEDTATRYPDWRPFDSANERFVRTPADSRLPPPVILANKTIVFKNPGPPQIKMTQPFIIKQSAAHACPSDNGRHPS